VGNTSLVISEKGVVYFFGENIYKDFVGANRIKGGEEETCRTPKIFKTLTNVI